MPGLFNFMQHPRVRQSFSSSSPQPPRAQTAETQAGPAPVAPAQGKLLPPRAWLWVCTISAALQLSFVSEAVFGHPE